MTPILDRREQKAFETLLKKVTFGDEPTVVIDSTATHQRFALEWDYINCVSFTTRMLAKIERQTRQMLESRFPEIHQVDMLIKVEGSKLTLSFEMPVE